MSQLPPLLERSIDRPATPAESAALEFLLGRIDYERAPPAGPSPGPFRLARMQAFLAALGDPQLSLPCVHIAGSKGKGSTAAMLAAMLTQAGFRTGLYTSPHIHRFEERIQLGGEPIPTGRFAELIERVRPVAAAMDSGELGGPTFFELTTAVAWLYFQAVAADVVVLEVGLGGRLDATNLCLPLLTLITSISRDHTRLLGERLDQIAREKAGIIKPGVPVLTGVDATEPLEVIRAVAADSGSECHVLSESIQLFPRAEPTTAADPLPRYEFQLRTPWREHPRLRAPLAGAHQARNAALAVAAVDWLDAVGGLLIPPAAVEEGLAAVRWPLRIEIVARAPLVILDAAHNEASVAALLETLRPLPVRRRVVLFAAARDKDARAMLMQLTDACDELILTRFLGNPRAIPVEELTRLAGAPQRCRVHAAPDPRAALETARALTGPDDALIVTGSFFLAGEVRELLNSNPMGT